MGLGSIEWIERIGIDSRTHKAAQYQEGISDPLPWRKHKYRVRRRCNRGPRWARGRPAGLAHARVEPKQLPTASRRRSEPLSKSRWPHGRIPRPAGLGEAGRPPSGPTRASVAPTCHSKFVLSPGRWVTDLHLILGCLVGLWINVNAFRSICLN